MIIKGRAYWVSTPYRAKKALLLTTTHCISVMGSVSASVVLFLFVKVPVDVSSV